MRFPIPWVLASLASLTLAGPAEARTWHRGPIGLGIVLGEPTGFTFKGFFAGPSAFQIHFGFGLGEKGKLVIAGDYLYHFQNVIPPLEQAGWLSPYLGVGVHVGFAKGNGFVGLRIPLGMSFQIASIPIEVFLEVAPGVSFVPETDALVDGGIGARWYF